MPRWLISNSRRDIWAPGARDRGRGPRSAASPLEVGARAPQDTGREIGCLGAKDPSWIRDHSSSASRPSPAPGTIVGTGGFSTQMIDFAPVRERRISIDELADGLSPAQLRELTNQSLDAMAWLIRNCDDRDVVRVVDDPEANDEAAASAAEVGLSWTLGHVIVHATASAEESAFLAAELARGVPHRPGRSRSEVPWQQVTTIAQCRHRLGESRRMRLASLDLWPDRPDLENRYQAREDGPSINAV